MPFSSASGKLYTHIMLQQLNTLGYVDHILDIGVGMGTYKKLMEGKFQTPVEWTGVEAWEPYIEQFGLKKLYDEIIVEDVRKLNLADLSSCDFVLCGDVLEHMTKEEALQIANDCLDNFNGMLISIPIIHSPQGAFAGNPFEVHVKDDWSHDEVLESSRYMRTFC